MARKVENLNAGSTFYYNRSKCHVVGFCNTFENGEAVVLIVYKYWIKYRKYWRHDVVEAGYCKCGLMSKEATNRLLAKQRK